MSGIKMKIESIMKMNSFKINFATLFLLAFLVAAAGNIFAQSQNELMLQGNKLYQENNYEAAVEIYQKILSQGFESPALYYNLGNSYFKAGKLGFAILNYERGLKLAPGDEDLSYNLKIANARTVDKITELPKLFIVQWWEILVTALSVTGWSIVVVIIYLILLSSIGLYLLAKKFSVQKYSFFGASSSLAVLILAVVILFSRYNHEASTNYGVLIDSAYSAKIAPDIKGSDAFIIHEGIKFIVEDKVNDWYKIRLVDGKVGWIQKNSFGQI